MCAIAPPIGLIAWLAPSPKLSVPPLMFAPVAGVTVNVTVWPTVAGLGDAENALSARAPTLTFVVAAVAEPAVAVTVAVALVVICVVAMPFASVFTVGADSVP